MKIRAYSAGDQGIHVTAPPFPNRRIRSLLRHTVPEEGLCSDVEELVQQAPDHTTAANLAGGGSQARLAAQARRPGAPGLWSSRSQSQTSNVSASLHLAARILQRACSAGLRWYL